MWRNNLWRWPCVRWRHHWILWNRECLRIPNWGGVGGRNRIWTNFHGGRHVALPCFYRSPERSNQTLALERPDPINYWWIPRLICVFRHLAPLPLLRRPLSVSVGAALVSSPELLMTTVPFYMFIVILMYRFKFQYMTFATCSSLELHKFSPRSQTSLLTSESKSRKVSTSYESLHSNMKQRVYL